MFIKLLYIIGASLWFKSHFNIHHAHLSISNVLSVKYKRSFQEITNFSIAVINTFDIWDEIELTQWRLLFTNPSMWIFHLFLSWGKYIVQYGNIYSTILVISILTKEKWVTPLPAPCLTPRNINSLVLV